MPYNNIERSNFSGSDTPASAIMDTNSNQNNYTNKIGYKNLNYIYHNSECEFSYVLKRTLSQFKNSFQLNKTWLKKKLHT